MIDLKQFYITSERLSLVQLYFNQMHRFNLLDANKKDAKQIENNGISNIIVMFLYSVLELQTSRVQVNCFVTFLLIIHFLSIISTIAYSIYLYSFAKIFWCPTPKNVIYPIPVMFSAMHTHSNHKGV